MTKAKRTDPQPYHTNKNQKEVRDYPCRPIPSHIVQLLPRYADSQAHKIMYWAAWDWVKTYEYEQDPDQTEEKWGQDGTRLDSGLFAIVPPSLKGPRVWLGDIARDLVQLFRTRGGIRSDRKAAMIAAWYLRAYGCYEPFRKERQYEFGAKVLSLHNRALQRR